MVVKMLESNNKALKLLNDRLDKMDIDVQNNSKRLDQREERDRDRDRDRVQ